MSFFFLASFLPDFQTIWTWVENGGYVVLFGILFMCGVGLPLPEDIPLIIAGALISQGHMQWQWAALAAWCGIIGGDCILYFLGRRLGVEIVKVRFIGTHVTRERIERAEKLFDKYGVWVVAIGRLFAGIRGAMVIAAGATKFNFVKFLIVDGLAAIVSGGLFMVLGYWVGSNLDKLEANMKVAEHSILIGALVLVVLVGGYLTWRGLRKKPTLGDKALAKIVPDDKPAPDDAPPAP